MSIKLYYGYKGYLENHNIRLLQEKIRMLQTAAKEMANEATRELLKDVDHNQDEIPEKVRILLENSTIFFQFGLGVWALEDEGEYLLYPFPPQSTIYDWKALLDKQDWLREWGYWDNSDMPEDMTEEEWETRRKEWNLVVEYGVPMAEAMFIIDLIPKYWLPTLKR